MTAVLRDRVVRLQIEFSPSDLWWWWWWAPVA